MAEPRISRNVAELLGIPLDDPDVIQENPAPTDDPTTCLHACHGECLTDGSESCAFSCHLDGPVTEEQYWAARAVCSGR